MKPNGLPSCSETAVTVPTLAAALQEATRRLGEAGVDTPARDAVLLLEHALGRRLQHRLEEQALTPAQQRSFAALVQRRLQREPVQRILGSWEFWSLDLELGPATLIPRADTETAVEAALAQIGSRRSPLRVLDLGTGSGAILLALLSELPESWGVGVDRAEAAIAVARRNAIRLGLAGRAAFLVGDWASALAGGFDLVVSNPPYIAAGDLAGLQPEVRQHEPLLALIAGDDGLDCYRRLVPALPGLLAPGGIAVLEHGEGQAPAVAGLLDTAGLGGLARRADLTGRVRVAIARKAA